MFKSKSKLINLVVYWSFVVCGMIGTDYLLINNVYGVTLITNPDSSYGYSYATLPRDLTENKFTIYLTFNLGSENVTPDTVYKNIGIRLPTYDTHKNDNIPDEQQDGWDFRKSKLKDIDIKSSNSEYYATVEIQVEGNTKGSLKNLVGDKPTLDIEIWYNNGSQEKITATIPSPINVAPTLEAITSGFRSIKIDWTVPKEALPNVDDTKTLPTSMDLFIIKKDKEVVTIPAKHYISSSTSDTIASCQITLSSINPEEGLQNCPETCTPSDKVYFDTSIKDPTDYRIVTTSVSKGSTTIGKLDMGVSYVILAQYKQDGLKRSQCGIATPYTNYSFSEFFEGTTSKEDDLSCFIATAAYGSAFTKELKILRWFRDTYLKTNTLGNKLVKLYYKYSPNLAKKIEKSPILAKITRTLLYIPVGICYLLFFLNPTGSSFIGFILLTGLVFTMFLFIRKKIYKID